MAAATLQIAPPTCPPSKHVRFYFSAYGVGEGIVELRGWKENDDRLIIEVGDQALGAQPHSEWRGRGLNIMRALVKSIVLPLTEVQGFERAVGELSHR